MRPQPGPQQHDQGGSHSRGVGRGGRDLRQRNRARVRPGYDVLVLSVQLRPLHRPAAPEWRLSGPARLRYENRGGGFRPAGCGRRNPLAASRQFRGGNGATRIACAI
ncbi:protein of unknown function [Candidatus Hydrogenisulfobacillus filiaventi]|uniref:Uncharacterized protein n=1 Tax=Candidatus Hydrogenisulfobacillus filiaventi TaxID=2707344 RepID=A0A6F8ZEU7_9FIRM|nr:protein of unknown function [Candidatus Hydrogenisulfobacillus filiaventi]